MKPEKILTILGFIMMVFGFILMYIPSIIGIQPSKETNNEGYILFCYGLLYVILFGICCREETMKEVKEQ